MYCFNPRLSLQDLAEKIISHYNRAIRRNQAMSHSSEGRGWNEGILQVKLQIMLVINFRSILIKSSVKMIPEEFNLCVYFNLQLDGQIEDLLQKTNVSSHSITSLEGFFSRVTAFHGASSCRRALIPLIILLLIDPRYIVPYRVSY